MGPVRERNTIVVIVLVAIAALALLVVRLVDPASLQGVDDLPQQEGFGIVAPEVKRDFMFQINGYRTENQGGQTLNMYFHYRYDAGIATSDIPNYLDLRAEVLEFMGDVDASENPYWETLNEELCTKLATRYPIQAISCQLQVYPDYRRGLPYEPGFHTSIHTIGDIEPLAIPGPLDERAD
jgi:hypothetical protein